MKVRPCRQAKTLGGVQNAGHGQPVMVTGPVPEQVIAFTELARVVAARPGDHQAG